MRTLKLSTLTAMCHDFRSAWKQLILTDIVYTAVAFVVLTPLVSLLLRVALAVLGIKILTDQDILIFLIGPIGWIMFIIVSSAVIAILALEQAALMTVFAGAAQGHRGSVRAALFHTIPLTWPVLKIAARLLALGLMTAAPFLLAIGGVCLIMFRRYDISYYLIVKPPAFWIAAGLAGTIGAALVVALVRVLLPAIYTLPLLLFEGVEPNLALGTSRKRASGHLRWLTVWIVAWYSVMFVIFAIGTGIISLLANLILPLVHSSLLLALATVGFLLILWAVINLGLSILGATTFTVMLMNLYRNVADCQKSVLRFKFQAKAERSVFFRFSRSHWVLMFCVLVIIALAVGLLTLNSVQADDVTEIAAHRGASAAAPENSMAAVEQAITDKADWVEIDVQESLDGVVLVIHDEDLKRLAGRSMKVWNTKAQQLRLIDIGKRFSPEFTGQKIPTLEEVLIACKGRVGVLIELKHYGHARKLEQRVIELVETLQMQNEIRIMSLKYDSIKKVRTLRPGWPVGLLSAVAVGDLTRVDADFLAVNTRIATKTFVNSARRRKKDVYVWTINDPVVMSTMISRGAKSIITDKPALAREVLRQRGELSTVERLILELAIFFGAPPPSSRDDA
ncbi:MAG: glycerophosphodiester phosphodiesterase family protein [Planctomycetota bacterium]